jgi:hypothetical protein
MVLFIMHEAAQEDAQSNKKKAERAAEKRRETEVSDQDPLGGGVLGKSPTPTAELVASKEDIEASFSKLLSGHSAWLGHPLSDATSYAQSNSPRPKEKLDRTLQECAGKEPALRSKHGMLRLFSESLWPSLKSRGWTTEQVTQGAYSGATHYRHGGEEVRQVCHSIMRSTCFGSHIDCFPCCVCSIAHLRRSLKLCRRFTRS